jgi:cell fate regulator YaaT (PSP1 superfamily)
MTNVTPVSPTPERAAAPSAPVSEPSMFDAPEWMGNTAPASQPGPKFAGIRFQQVGKVYSYIADGFSQLKVGDWVIVDTVRGRQMGQVATLKRPRNAGDFGVFKRIERLAGGRDMAMRHYYENKELEAMIACRAESKALDMPIKIVKAEYSFDGQTLTFMFSSDQEERIETNDLRQVMSRLYRARIDMRQISPREVAKIIGGMGACGIEQRCCSRFLTDFSPISIKHAKEQGLSLNPHDITGMCGRLRCCLIYEYEQYVEARRQLPKKNAIVGTPFGQGKVIDHLPLRDSVLVLIGEGETAKGIVVHREQIVPLEELKRLQDKAASGTCDKHEGGNCDCGKGKTKAQGAPAEAAQIEADVAATVVIDTVQAAPAASPVRQQQGNASRNPKHVKKGNRPAQSSGAQEARPAGQARSEVQGRQGQPEGDSRRQQQGQPSANKPGEQTDPRQNRHTLIRPKHMRDHAERQPRAGQVPPPQTTTLPSAAEIAATENTSEAVNAASGQTTDNANPALRRPLQRRPLQRRPSSPANIDQPPQPTQES